MGTATAKGVSQIKPLDPFAQQQAETTAATRGVAFEPTGQTGNMSAVGNKSGQAICVRGAEFPQSPQAIQMKIKGKGSIEIHMDSPDGPLLSTLTFDTDTWQTLTKPLDKRIKANTTFTSYSGTESSYLTNGNSQNNESVGRICPVSLHPCDDIAAQFEPTHNKPASYFASVLPPYWQSFAMPLAKPCQLVGKKDKSNIAVRKEAEARPQYNSANGKETD